MSVEPFPAPTFGKESTMIYRIAPSRSRQNARVVLLSLLLVAVASPGHSAGGRDTSFGGLWNVSVGKNVMCHAVAPDGKIVLAGTSGEAIIVCRRLSNGAPDNGFGVNGTATLVYSSIPLAARSVAVQPDGKIVVAGTGDYEGLKGIKVFRLTTSGARDTGFGIDGMASAWISDYSNNPQKVLIQPDGKIVVAGFANIGGDDDFAAARFTSGGNLDPSFSGDGQVSIGFGGTDVCYDAALQADGKLVMVGGTEGLTFHDEDFAVARLHIDGSLDRSFNNNGTLTTGFGDFYDRAYAVVIQPWDQRIVVVGQGSLSDDKGRAARYYSSDGSRDDSFDGDGKMNLAFTATDAVVTTGGKIAFIGIDENGYARAQRLNASGSMDTEWQGDGDVLVDTDISERPSLSLLADGRVLTVAPKGSDCWLRRYWADGEEDSGGKQSAAFDDATFPAGSQEIIDDIAVQADRKFVVAGYVRNAAFTESDFALARFHPDGRLDNTFGVNGRVAFSFGNDDFAKALKIQPDGKIVVVGYTGTGNAMNFLIARFNTNGTLDPSFGFGGFNVMDFAGGPDQGWALALQPDGKIVVAGTVYNGTRNVYGVCRFSSDGTADHSFDGDGKRLYEFPGGLSHFATSVVVQSSGRIVVGGSLGGNLALVAFTSNGSIDTFFGAGSTGGTGRDLGGSDYLETMAMGTDGRIYAAGARVISGHGTSFLTRWPASAGLVICNPVCPWSTTYVDYPGSAWIDAMDVRSDGSIVIAGMIGSIVHWAQFSLGSMYPSATGLVEFPGTGTQGLAVRFAGPDRIVVGGAHYFQGDRNMTLALFEATPNTTVSVDEPLAIGPAVRLENPFPNPLVGRSTLAFELPRAQSVSLAIHDVSGRRVRVLQEGALAAGRHQRFWDGTDEQGRSVAAGVYFVRLVAGTEHAGASILVLR
jgi:uncharacterized delta-60 repeat protein